MTALDLPLGDVEPEDGYDAGDPPEERERVLWLVLASIAVEHLRPCHDGLRVLARSRGLVRLTGDLTPTRRTTVLAVAALALLEAVDLSP